jgi:ammonia channel protein AmtB
LSTLSVNNTNIFNDKLKIILNQLYFCWMFFNAGSSLAITGDKIYITGTAGMNTLISGASGGITVFIIHYILSE